MERESKHDVFSADTATRTKQVLAAAIQKDPYVPAPLWWGPLVPSLQLRYAREESWLVKRRAQWQGHVVAALLALEVGEESFTVLRKEETRM